MTLGDLDTATLFYLSVPSFGDAFTTALLAATAGNGAPLRALALEFEVDLDGASLVGPQWAFGCNDTADRLSPAGRGGWRRHWTTATGRWPPMPSPTTSPAAPTGPVRRWRYTAWPLPPPMGSW